MARPGRRPKDPVLAIARDIKGLNATQRRDLMRLLELADMLPEEDSIDDSEPDSGEAAG